MEIIDITVALHDTIPSWPGSCGFKRTQVTDVKKGDTGNGSQVIAGSASGGLNLAAVEPGEYKLICLPLKFVGADGAPARAILRR